ncbi:unnamed protein product [Symbiodinium sp. CCMP2592]|nr:unnamed protein product [Symbiodinium sp. CCMP2592]
MGMPLRHYLGTMAASFGSMALGSICVHTYMQPEMNSDMVASDFEKEAQARRNAIEEVTKLAMDERFGPAVDGTASRTGKLSKLSCETLRYRRLQASEMTPDCVLTVSLDSVVFEPSIWHMFQDQDGDGKAAMSYYVGAEPRNPVQCEKFWRNRIDAEDWNSSLLEEAKRESVLPELQKARERLGTGRSQRVGTACSGISARSSVSGMSCRSTVLSVELEIERERRQAAEKELQELRRKLDSMNGASSTASHGRAKLPESSNTSKSRRSR